MKRESHTVYGAAAGYLVAGLPGALLGGLVASLPDDMEPIFDFEHRKTSHSAWMVMVIYMLLSQLSIIVGLDSRYALAMTAGYVSHILVDAMTISGVYWLSPLNMRHKFHLLPRKLRIRTGSSLDSLLAGIVGVWLCWMVFPEAAIFFSEFDFEQLLSLIS